MFGYKSKIIFVFNVSRNDAIKIRWTTENMIRASLWDNLLVGKYSSHGKVKSNLSAFHKSIIICGSNYEQSCVKMIQIIFKLRDQNKFFYILNNFWTYCCRDYVRKN